MRNKALLHKAVSALFELAHEPNTPANVSSLAENYANSLLPEPKAEKPKAEKPKAEKEEDLPWDDEDGELDDIDPDKVSILKLMESIDPKKWTHYLAGNNLVSSEEEVDKLNEEHGVDRGVAAAALNLRNAKPKTLKNLVEVEKGDKYHVKIKEKLDNGGSKKFYDFLTRHGTNATVIKDFIR